MTLSQIGFIGLGQMGAPIAGHIAAAGYSVLGFDIAGTEGQIGDNRDRVEAQLCRQARVPSGVRRARNRGSTRSRRRWAAIWGEFP